LIRHEIETEFAVE